MSVIVTGHEAADFDAVAGSVAAARLYPHATVVVGRRLAPEVKRFIALHRERFPIVRYSEVDFEDAETLVLVDVRSRRRVSHVQPLLDRAAEGRLRVDVWDHHPPGDDDVEGEAIHIAPVGAVTTLLVETLRARGFAVDPMEATLYALAIHSDTGSLTFASSTARDAAALAWLMSRGVQMDALQRFLTPPLTPLQREAVVQVLSAVEVLEVRGHTVGLAEVALPRDVDGMAVVVSEALALAGVRALFVLLTVENRSDRVRVQLIGRSALPGVNVGEVLRDLGGGGHGGAGSATIRDQAPEAVRERLVEALEGNARPPSRVRDLMSVRVRSVTPAHRLLEVRALFEQWGVTGAPVVDEVGSLVGVISRRDIERAEREGRAQLSVASCMSHHPVCVAPAEPLPVAFELIVKNDIGRLPVVEGGQVLGIVTRSDLLQASYGTTSTASDGPSES